jgi:TerC family integral membrane protein
MIALSEIFSARWGFFVIAVLFFLALDLGVFHRRARVVRFREALIWTALWFVLAMLFCWIIAPSLIQTWGRTQTDEFITGYILELSLSMDNVFVIALIFAYFRVPQQYQHGVLFWGILGALVMRGVMIWIGVELVERFHWMFYVFGAFLIITALKMLFGGEQEVHPERNLAIRLARRFFPVSAQYHGSKFLTAVNGRRTLTPLALVLLMVETTDLIFAVDSIPAILGVTQNRYIVFTSNIFAILGLRSLYFVLAGAIEYFRYLKIGLAVVLAFIGVKMFLAQTDYKISTTQSLWIVAGIIAISIITSLVAAWVERRAKSRSSRPHG